MQFGARTTIFLALLRYFNANREFAQKWPLSRKGGTEVKIPLQSREETVPSSFIFIQWKRSLALRLWRMNECPGLGSLDGLEGKLGGKAAQILASAGPIHYLSSLCPSAQTVF